MTSQGDRRKTKDVEADVGREGGVNSEGGVGLRGSLFLFLECSLQTVCCREGKVGKQRGCSKEDQRATFLLSDFSPPLSCHGCFCCCFCCFCYVGGGVSKEEQWGVER